MLILANEKSPFPCDETTLLGQHGFSLLPYNQPIKAFHNSNLEIEDDFNLGYSFPGSISESRKLSVPSNIYNSDRIRASYINAFCQREMGCKVAKKFETPLFLYERMNLLKTIKGHTNASYCVTFDKTGDLIITGSDDRLIKVWSSKTGLLLATLRGHDGDIIQLDIDSSNKIIASSSNDHTIRLWSLVDFSPLAILADGHTEPITEMTFCYDLNQLYLITTALDGNIVRWKLLNKEGYIHADELGEMALLFSKETANVPSGITGAAISPGGTRIVTGHTDGRCVVWSLNPLKIIQVIDAHASEVSCISWNHSGSRFFSGSYDGTIRIYDFDALEGWKCTHNINVSEGSRGSHRVLMAMWSKTDDYIVLTITKAPHNTRLRVFDALTGKLVHKLSEHTKEIHVLDNHPKDPRIFVSSGYDGKVIYWDIQTGTAISIFKAEADHEVAFYDGEYSPNGSIFISIDNSGTFWVFGYGDGQNYTAPAEQFFLNDYHPLVADASGFVVDEATNTPPHQLPRQILCNIFFHPYDHQPIPPPYNLQSFTEDDYTYQSSLRGMLYLEEMASLCKYSPSNVAYPSFIEGKSDCVYYKQKLIFSL